MTCELVYCHWHGVGWFHWITSFSFTSSGLLFSLWPLRYHLIGLGQSRIHISVYLFDAGVMLHVSGYENERCCITCFSGVYAW